MRRDDPTSLASVSTEERAADESLSSPLPAALEVSLCEALGGKSENRKSGQGSEQGEYAAASRMHWHRTSPLHPCVLHLAFDCHDYLLLPPDRCDHCPFQ